MHVLALEPYYGGSHRAFLDGWMRHSRHRFTPLTLPAHHWKWRMRHAAVTFADQLRGRDDLGPIDVTWCSDMLDLATFLGLAPPSLAERPRVVYFHENQLAYPVRRADARDAHFGLTNATTALAADRVWFNSAFNRDSLLEGLGKLLAKMPDRSLADVPQRIAERSEVRPPGIEPIAPRPPRDPGEPGALHVLWAARWEHDKDPVTFFAALERLAGRGIPFRLSVIGEQFRDVPAIFETARRRFGPRLVRWGYQPTRDGYEAALRDADVIVSTAQHEFFGLSVIEAVSAGCYPLLPRRLAYPELFSDDEFFYDGSAMQLADRLAQLAAKAQQGDPWGGDRERARRQVERYAWSYVAPALDDALDEVAAQHAR